MYTSLCIARVFDDHRSCQKLINYITNIKAKSKRYNWIQKIPVLKRLFIQNFCKRSRCLEKNPVFLFLSKKKKKWKKEFSPSFQVHVVLSIVDRSQFKINENYPDFFCHVNDTLLHWRGKCTECIVIHRLCY
jgi:hypothetical protein